MMCSHQGTSCWPGRNSRPSAPIMIPAMIRPMISTVLLPSDAAPPVRLLAARSLRVFPGGGNRSGRSDAACRLQGAEAHPAFYRLTDLDVCQVCGDDDDSPAAFVGQVQNAALAAQR